MEVVAGVIHRDGRVLACQRREDATFPLKWEFPGGKVKEGEERVVALRRELREELAIEIEEPTEIHRGRHVYSRQLQVDLTFFSVGGYQGVLTNLNFQKILWVEPGTQQVFSSRKVLGTVGE